MKIFAGKEKFGKLCFIFLVFISVIIGGIVAYGSEDSSTKTAIYSMYTVPPYKEKQSTYTDVYNTLLEQKKNEKILKNYLKDTHLTANKDKVFESYYNRLISCCNFFNDVCYSVEGDIQSLTSWNPRLSKGEKEIFGSYYEKSIHITPIMEKNEFGDDTIKTLKITSPQVPFMKIIYAGEGFFESKVDYQYLYDNYAKYLTSAYSDYLKIRLKEDTDMNGVAYYNDAALTVTKLKLMDWIMVWQKFREKYPAFKTEEVEQRLHLYTSDFMVAYENSFFMTFDTDNNLLPEAKKDYETFLKTVNPNTPEYKMVEKYYAVLKKNKYKYTNEVSVCLDEWRNKYDGNVFEIMH